MEKKQEAQANLERAKKLTCGKHVRNGHHKLGAEVLESIRRHNRLKAEEEQQAASKRCDAFDDMVQKVTDIRTKGSPSKLSKKDLRTMNGYKKIGRGDGKLFTSLEGLKDQWNE